MEEKIESIEQNNTWDLTTLSKEHRESGVKWVYIEGEEKSPWRGREIQTRLVAKDYK